MVDYSAWEKIEVSDDEDETHPNIDTPSLFRLRHTARLDKMKELDEMKSQLGEMREMYSCLKKDIVNYKLAHEGDRNPDGKDKEDASEVDEDDEETLRLLEKDIEELAKEVETKEKNLPWNVDTISTEKFSKSFINSGSSSKPQQDYDSFLEKHEPLLESFGNLSSLVESQKFLEDNPFLVSSSTSEYLLKEAIASTLELEVSESTPEEQDQLRVKIDRLCVQCVTIHLLLRMMEEIGGGACGGGGGDLKSVVSFYFSRIGTELPAFHEEVTSLRSRVQIEAEDRARQLRLGPGGLDPLEVAQELPEDLRKCFILRDTELLKAVLAKMDPREAVRIMGRCVDSGLWIPGSPDDSETSPDSADTPKDETTKVSNAVQDDEASKVSNAFQDDEASKVSNAFQDDEASKVSNAFQDDEASKVSNEILADEASDILEASNTSN